MDRLDWLDVCEVWEEMKEPRDSVLRPGLALVELFLLQNIFLGGKNFR